MPGFGLTHVPSFQDLRWKRTGRCLKDSLKFIALEILYSICSVYIVMLSFDKSDLFSRNSWKQFSQKYVIYEI